MAGFWIVVLVVLCGGAAWLYIHLLQKEQRRQVKGQRKTASQRSGASQVAANLQEMYGGAAQAAQAPQKVVVPNTPMRARSESHVAAANGATAAACSPRRLGGLTWVGPNEMVEVAGVRTAAPMTYFADT